MYLSLDFLDAKNSIEKSMELRKEADETAKSNPGYYYFNGNCKIVTVFGDYLCFLFPNFNSFAEVCTKIFKFPSKNTLVTTKPDHILHQGFDQYHITKGTEFYYSLYEDKFVEYLTPLKNI